MRHCRTTSDHRDDSVGVWCDHSAPRRGRAASPQVACRDTSVPGIRTHDPDEPTMLVYVLDVYDPWSWAYLPSVGTVLEAACPVVEVEVVIAGRHDGASVSALAQSVEAVRSGTGTRFGTGFLRELESGQLALDSARAAAGIIGLLAADQRRHVSTVLRAVQREFFLHGRTVDSPGVLGNVASQLSLDGPAIEVFAASERAREMAVEDFAVAVDLDPDLRPLLIASHGGTVFEFDGLGASGDRLVDQFRSVLARP